MNCVSKVLGKVLCIHSDVNFSCKRKQLYVLFLVRVQKPLTFGSRCEPFSTTDITVIYFIESKVVRRPITTDPSLRSANLTNASVFTTLQTQ